MKYFYSEEPAISQHHGQNNHNVPHPNTKCLLITEFIRPITILIENLSTEQVMHGIYGITTAIQFLHEKAQMSHNNISESSIYVNCKQVWKLNDFELALSFGNLNKENLKEIYSFENKNAITPEEEINYKNPNKLDLNRVFQQVPHSIDAYGWAITILNLLPSYHNATKSFKTFFGDDTSILDE